MATNASAYTGEALLNALKKSAKENPPERLTAEGFVVGVAATLGTANAMCLPPNVTVPQLVALVQKYIEERPKE